MNEGTYVYFFELNPIAAIITTATYMKNPYTHAGYPNTVPGAPKDGQDALVFANSSRYER